MKREDVELVTVELGLGRGVLTMLDELAAIVGTHRNHIIREILRAGVTQQMKDLMLIQGGRAKILRETEKLDHWLLHIVKSILAEAGLSPQHLKRVKKIRPPWAVEAVGETPEEERDVV